MLPAPPEGVEYIDLHCNQLDPVEDTAEAALEVSSHLSLVRSSHQLLNRRPHVPHRTPLNLAEVISEAVYGSKPQEEVGDEWFDETERVRGRVRLRIGVTKQARKLGRLVGRGSTEESKDARGKKGRGVPRVVIEESGDGASLGGRLTTLYPSRSTEAGGELSPTQSVESLESEVSYASSFRTSFDGGTSIRSPSPSPNPLARSPSIAESTTTLAQVQRTLTLSSDQPGLRSRRRDDRSNFSTRKKLASIRPADFQRMLAKRRKKLAMGLGDGGEEELEAALVAAGVEMGGEEQYVLDVLYEHQRGIVVFGEPKFSSALLAQFDPAPWTDEHFKDSPFTPHDHPLPTPFWLWDHPQWFIDMGSDVDESGWSYAYRFRSSHWRGEADNWRSFVRRRRWIRGRSYTPKSLLPTDPLPCTPMCDIDWDVLRHSILPDHPIGQDEVIEIEGIGLKAACSLLPLPTERKDDIFSFTSSNPLNPFLPWSLIKRSGADLIARRKERDPAGSRSEEELWGVWKDAVVEINYRKVGKVLRGCRLDREKLGYWSWWVGRDGGLGEQMAMGGGDAIERPEIEDVWDLVEGRLDHILQAFEFQNSRLYLLNLILTLHPLSHSHHHYASIDRSSPHEPKVLSPKGVGSKLGRRIDFYSDVKELMKHYEGVVASSEDEET